MLLKNSDINDFEVPLLLAAATHHTPAEAARRDREEYMSSRMLVLFTTATAETQ